MCLNDQRGPLGHLAQIDDQRLPGPHRYWTSLRLNGTKAARQVAVNACHRAHCPDGDAVSGDDRDRALRMVDKSDLKALQIRKPTSALAYVYSHRLSSVRLHAGQVVQVR
jgi:hypothetical protein